MTDAQPANGPKHTSWGEAIGWLVAAAIVVAAVIALTPRSEDVSPSEMQSACANMVASWAGVDIDQVEGRDVSSENMSSSSWDFRGTYPGGEWACGGPGGQAEPAQTMVYPDGGTAQQVR